MMTYHFTLLLGGAFTLEDEGLFEGLYASGCNDALFGSRDGVAYAEFDREASSFAAAVGTAISQIERSATTSPGGSGITVLRVEPDDYVNAAEIADRTHRTRESIRLLVDGVRGPGGFPAPLGWLGSRSRLWRWYEVATWFAEKLGERHGDPREAAFVAALNAALEFRRVSPSLAPGEAEEALSLLQKGYAHFAGSC